MIGSAFVLLTPAHWVGLVFADLRRMVGVALDTSAKPRPTKLRYMRTAAGLVALYPRVLQPPPYLAFVQDYRLGVKPGTDEPQMRLASDNYGIGALLEEITGTSHNPLDLKEVALVPLVEVTGLHNDEYLGRADSQAVAPASPVVLHNGEPQDARLIPA